MTDGAADLPGTTSPPRNTAAIALLVCAACVASIAPFLRLFEFSNGGENAVVATVVEMRRGGPWLVPTLHEEVRTKKPPLAAWLSALSARPATVARFDDPDPVVRGAAYADFGLQVRVPSLVAMAGVLLGTFVLGRMIGGPGLGVVAIAVCGSSLFWLRNARLATTDAHLALWVTVANCLFAAAVFDARKRWPGLVAGGAALGMAMMAKGPVALLQTVLPVLAFVAWRRWAFGPANRQDKARTASPSFRSWLVPALIGLVLFAVIGMSWYAYVLLQRPEVAAEWRMELTREGAASPEPSKWYNYVQLLGVMMPWTLFLVAGLIGSATLAVRAGKPSQGAADERSDRIVLGLFLLIVPILVMSLFRDREIRYLIPLLAPAAIVAAWGVLELIGAGAPRKLATTLLVAAFHWLALAVAAIGLPLAAWPLGKLLTRDGEPWYSPRMALLAAEVFLVLIVVAVILQRRWRVAALVGATLVVMLVWNVVFNLGYRDHREGRSELRPLAEQIRRAHPGVQVYSFRPDRPIRNAPIDLSIYLNDVVEKVGDPSELAKTSGPRVYVVREKHKTPLADPSPLAPPANTGEWKFMSATPVDNAYWYAFSTAK